jgi:3-hydroxyisobutyrate dehydrogenase-like beta-hydroxyacid dehydrogenase
MKIGFAGLGQMGRPIAMNLLKGGADLVVAARNADSFGELERQGATATLDFTRLAEADVIFFCLSDGEAVKALLFGAVGIAPALSAGKIVVDLGTTDYATTIALGRQLAEGDVNFLDAPISGMASRAIKGTLTVMCGGARAAFETVRPLLDHIGNKILHVGPAGSGQLIKLINQLLFDINAAALAEVLPAAMKLGLDPVLVGEVVNSGTGRSYASEFFIPRILAGSFTNGYPMKHAYKDIVSGARISAELGLPMPVLAAATATYQTALLQGHGDKDKSGMIRMFEDLLGVTFRTAPPKQSDQD